MSKSNTTKTIWPRSVRYAAIAIILAGIITLMVVGKSFLVPLAVAVVLAYLVLSILSIFKHLTILKWDPPHWLDITMATLTTAGVLWAIVAIFNQQIGQLVGLLPTYETQYNSIVLWLNGWLPSVGIDSASTLLSSLSLVDVATTISKNAVRFGATSLLVAVYTILILSEYRSIKRKIIKILADKGYAMQGNNIIATITKQSGTYIRIKSLSSFLTGLLTYIVLILFGVDVPLLWALLAFVLNFIPSVGSIVAVALPVVLSVLQFGNPAITMPLTLSLFGAQVGVANWLEPKIAGSQLNVSPLMIVLALVLFGTLWGVVGMLLSVPFLLIMRVAFDQFKSTKPLALLLSGKK